MNTYMGAVCDEFSVISRLFLKLDLNLQRETLLHFFDRIRREYPGLRKLRRRDDGGLLLEEEPNDEGSRRWLRVDVGGLRFGQHSPASIEEVHRFGQLVMTQAPYHLTLSEIDYDHQEVIYGFDLEYRGNHDQLVAETLLADQTAIQFLAGGHARHIIDAQPYLGVALTPECDVQAYVEVKSRTSTYEVRNESYEPQPISVYLTVRKYWGIDASHSLDEVLASLFEHADELAREKVVPHFVNPLAAAIASRS